MSEHAVRKEIQEDLQDAAAGRGRVLYLEGKTDVPILLALLGAGEGQATTRGVLHDGVLLRLLSGSNTVKQYLDIAQKYDIPGLFGVIDGDGTPLSTLSAEFDAPYAGPRFRWKGYCIESLLARLTAAWPRAWGDPPDWRSTLLSYAPYVAINRLWHDLRDRLTHAGLGRFIKPVHTEPPRGVDEFLAKLSRGQRDLANLDVEAMFTAELNTFTTALDRSLDEAHALLDGKWLVEAFAPRHTRRTQDECRDEWTRAVRDTGGDPEILAWWRRTLAA